MRSSAFAMTILKHPKTGGYYLRRVVPKALRAKLKRTEIRISLKTKDPREAKRRYAAADLQAQAILEGPRALTHAEIMGLVGDWYRDALKRREVNPGKPADLEHEMDELRWATGDQDDEPNYTEDALGASLRRADALLKSAGLSADEASRVKLAEQLLEHEKEMVLTLSKRARGDYRPDESGAKLPTLQKEAANLTFGKLIEAWKTEQRPEAKTVYTFERQVDRFVAHVGHDDASRVTKQEVNAFKAALLGDGLSSKTVRNYLFVLKALFNYAVAADLLTVNPAVGVKIPPKDKTKGRRGYADDEARTILQAARKEKGALRWVPWVCAYTGARLDEVCQLTAGDVRRTEDGIAYIAIHAFDDGKRVKTSSSVREVPLHSALVAEGFLKFATRDDPAGPLFDDLTPDRFGRRGGSGTKKMSRWVRGLGITDKRLGPAHSWRHRFLTVWREAELPREVGFSITGHTEGRGVGDSYGDGYSIRVKAAALEKVPALVLGK